MTPRLSAVLLLASAGLTAAAGTVPPDDKILKSFPFRPGLEVTVQVTVGDVSVVAWDRDEVSVEVTRRLPDGVSTAALPVVIELEGSRIRVEARQPDDGRDPALRADILVKVPTLASLPDIEVFEGRLDIEGLHGTVTAAVERGTIAAREVGGRLRLETTAGDIALDRAELEKGGLIRCRTFNGDVRIGLLRPPADARVLLLTLNGAISSNLPLSERPGFGPRFREATIGSGQYLISVDVVRGDIAVQVAQQ